MKKLILLFLLLKITVNAQNIRQIFNFSFEETLGLGGIGDFEIGNNADVLIDVKECYDSKMYNFFPHARTTPPKMPPSFWTDLKPN